MTTPKGIRTGIWYADSVFQNTESEIILHNLVVMQKKQNPDSWQPFTWEQYAKFRNETSTEKVSEKERGVLDAFVNGGKPVWNTSAYLSPGWLKFENGQYSFAEKTVQMLAAKWPEK